jgi:translation initiation factor 5B
MHGLEPQTIESLQLLLKRKTPFIVALNKVDRLYDYQSNPRKDIWQHLRAQPKNTQIEFEQRWRDTTAQFSEQGINVALANENKDLDEYVSVIPTSAINGDGIGNLMAYIVEQSQTRLAKTLAFCDELDCTVMEVCNNLRVAIFSVLGSFGSRSWHDYRRYSGEWIFTCE